MTIQNISRLDMPQTLTNQLPNISVIHENITSRPLFEGVWPIPDGVTLNSYLVKGGQKTALIDLTADWEEAAASFENQLDTSIAGPECGAYRGVDYLVLNHLEPDHTGYLRGFLAKHPETEVIATAKGCTLVKDFLKAGDSLKMRAVKDGDVLDLGGATLVFYEIPFVHWPETMCTFEKESGTLFSCDAFGGYGTAGERIFDDEFDKEEHKKFEAESARYYATIVASFSASVKKAIDKLAAAQLNIKTVAPSHGMVWRTQPEEIIKRYARFAGYNTGGEMEEEICILCASMYGNTSLAAHAVERGIKNSNKDIKVHFISIPETDASYALMAALHSKGVVIAAPTCDYALFAPMAHLLDLFKRKKITDKKALRIGSFGWSGGAQKEYDALIAPLKWQSIEPYEWKGVPSSEDIKVLEERGSLLAESVHISIRPSGLLDNHSV